MPRVPSDHGSIETLRATVERVGRTDRLKVVLPTDATVDAESVVRLVVDGQTCHTRIETDFDGRVEFRGAFPSPTLARDPDADGDRLPDWLDEAGIDAGQSVLVDVVTEGFQYGLRAPGERVVYEVDDRPDDGLASIARDLEE